MKNPMIDCARRWPAALAAVLLVALFAGCALWHGRVFKNQVGLQLWSVRHQMAKDVPGTLTEVRDWGIKFVELAGTEHLTPAQFKSQLNQHGLDAVSGHFGYDRFRDNPEAVMREAAQLGLVYVGCAWIPHQGAFDEVACRQAIAVFNRASEVAEKHHMKFFYHTHGYEFQPYQNGTMFDLLVTGTHPEVKFEMDIFWVAHAGQNCATLLEKYPHRFDLMHLKDMKKGTPIGLLTGSSPDSNDVVLGTGQLDMPGILKAARKSGTKWYFIEDESDVSEQQIPQSIRYLENLRY